MWGNERGLIEGLMRLARASVADDSTFRLAWRTCAFGDNDQPLIVSEVEQALDWLEQVLERHGELHEIVRVVAVTDESQMTLAEYWALRARAQAVLAGVQEPPRATDVPPPGRPNPLRKSGFSQHTEKPLPRPSELDDLR